VFLLARHYCGHVRAAVAADERSRQMVRAERLRTTLLAHRATYDDDLLAETLARRPDAPHEVLGAIDAAKGQALLDAAKGQALLDAAKGQALLDAVDAGIRPGTGIVDDRGLGTKVSAEPSDIEAGSRTCPSGAVAVDGLRAATARARADMAW